MKQAYETINPTNGYVIKSYPTLSESELEDVIQSVNKAQKSWKKISLDERVKKLRALADILKKHQTKAAELMATEMGKPLAQGIGEVQKCIDNANYYADKLHEYLEPEKIDLPDIEAYRYFEPIGIIYAVMPWNFPLWQVLRCAVPNVAAGNGMILKHAENVIGSAQLIEQVYKEAGFPDNLVKSVVIDLSLSNYIIDHSYVQGVTLTGSNRAGKAVGSASGNAMKKVVLELGGSDPYLILKDADIEKASKACITSRLSNAGQVCVSPKRIIVDQTIKAEFEKYAVAEAQKFVIGNPLDSAISMGPMARADLRAELHKQVQESIAKGAKLLLGGELPEGKGYFYPATVLTNVKAGMPAFDQELFGPVVTIIEASSEEEALELANQSEFGLGGAVFTQDIAKGMHIASKEIESGMCNVNQSVASDPRIPFGGIKQSGFGREISKEGIREFVNVKSVVVNRN
jgi:succinate-semialdehyde dehydrogenase / glutarate-semialdehyde dehydrogenase